MKPCLAHLAVAFGLGIAAAAQAAPPWDAPGSVRVEAREQAVPTAQGLAKSGQLRAAHSHAVRLAPPAREKAAQLRAPSKWAPLQIGFSRPIRPLETDAATRAALEWEALPDGSRVADVAVTSEDAAALRLGLRISRLPDDAILRFKGPRDEKLFEIRGRSVNAAAPRNAQAGSSSAPSWDWWSPVVDGDTAIVEIELPRGTDPSAVAVSIPLVSHLVTSIASGFATPTTIGSSGACEVDASCSTGWSNQRNAVAEMVFSDAANTYLCTGTLLADQDTGTNLPYFLTANHCISTQSSASSLVTYWFYRSGSCDSGIPGPYQQLTGGATLLYHSSTTDTSFLRLANLPPQGTYYAGWYVASSPPAAGSAVTGLHHPKGDLLKISQGSLLDYASCTAPDSAGQFTCSSGLAASGATFYETQWTRGITEPGSSGSALFLGNGLVAGQLFGGSGDCSTPGTDFYGRFDVAYNAALKAWLSTPVALSVARAGSGSGSVSSTPAGISCGSTCNASFNPGTSVSLNATPSAGSSFAGWSGSCTGTGACVVTMDAQKTVSATFQPVPQVLTVSTSGNGSVTSAPAGIDCGAQCSASFTYGTAVTLGASAQPGSIFNGWGGACAGSGNCTLTMSQAKSVTATFVVPPPADLALTQATEQDPAAIGRDVILTLTLTNNGPGNASGVMVTDTLPAGAVFVGPLSGCSSSGETVSCPIGPLAYGASTRLTLVVRPTVAGTMRNDASVSGVGADPDPSNNGASLTIPVDASPASHLSNISTRGKVLTGNDVMIGGFIIGGSGQKTVAITATGPSLSAFGVPNPISNPMLTLVRQSDGAVIATNDDWQSDANAALLQASGFAPTDAHEAGLYVALPPGAYTAIVSGVNGVTGVSVIGVFEVDHPEIPLVNISTRARVLTGDDVMIGGFTVTGTGPQTVVVTVAGPSLTAYGITNPLANPMLTLVRSSDQSIVATNDDWQSAPNAAQVWALGLAPSNPAESALVLTLDPGAYTAIVSGANGGTGVAVIGVYGP